MQGLRQLGAVPVKGVGLDAQFPGQHISALAVLDGCRMGHVDGLRDGAGDKRLAGRHHADMAVHRQVAFTGAAAGIGTIEDGQVLIFQVRRTFQGHGAAHMDIGGFDLVPGEAQLAEHVKRHVVELGCRETKGFRAEFFAEGELVEDEFNIKGFYQRTFDDFQDILGETFFRQGFMVDALCRLQGALAGGV